MNIVIGPIQRTPLRILARSHLDVATPGRGFTDLTPALQRFLERAEARDGLLALFVRHTSASLTVQENTDPDVRADLMDALARLAPEGMDYRHSLEGADDMPAHVRTTLSDVSLALPVSGGRLELGTWQAVYLIEHRTRPHRREVGILFVGA